VYPDDGALTEPGRELLLGPTMLQQTLQVQEQQQTSTGDQSLFRHLLLFQRDILKKPNE